MHLVANRKLAVVLGAVTGIVGLIAMFRLISDAFEGPLSTFSWFFVSLAMVPWVAYSAWRARHGRLTGLSVLAISVMCLAGLVSVWLSTLGAVVALTCSLVAFVVIWVNDWPQRRPAGEDRFVRIEELTDDGDDEPVEQPREEALSRAQPAA